MTSNEIPEECLEEMEPKDIADGDFDAGIWKEEIMEIVADEMDGNESADKK